MPNSMKLLTTWRFRRPFTERRSRDGLPILPKVTFGTVHTGGRALSVCVDGMLSTDDPPDNSGEMWSSNYYCSDIGSRDERLALL
jgi:hypothetical protein